MPEKTCNIAGICLAFLVRSPRGRSGAVRLPLAGAACAAALSLAFVFFAARSRWASAPEPPLPDVAARIEFTEPVAQKWADGSGARRAEPARGPGSDGVAADARPPLGAPAQEPAHEPEPQAGAAPAQPAPRPRDIVAYSPMGRPINRVFQNARTNEPAPRMELRTGLDRTLNLIANAEPGMPPPPKLDLRSPNEDILQSLDTDIVLLQDDDESLAQASNVADLKREMKLYLFEGGDADAFIGAYRDWLQLAYESRSAARSRMLELLREGDREGALRFVEERNAAFAGEGIAPLSIPPLFNANTKQQP